MVGSNHQPVNHTPHDFGQLKLTLTQVITWGSPDFGGDCSEAGNCSYGHLSVISTYNPIYRMYNPIYNQL
jgi:hypothetical protein